MVGVITYITNECIDMCHTRFDVRYCPSSLGSVWRNDIYNESDFLARERERPVIVIYEHVVVAVEIEMCTSARWRNDIYNSFMHNDISRMT